MSFRLEKANVAHNAKWVGMFLKAAMEENPKLLTELLAAGVDKDVQNSDGYTALHYAALHDDTTCTRILLDAGASPSMENRLMRTALHVAVLAGKPSEVQILLEYGADVDAVDTFGRTALHYAVLSLIDISMVQILVSAGAFLDAEDDRGFTAFKAAISQNKIGPAVVLAAAGADPALPPGAQMPPEVTAAVRGRLAALEARDSAVPEVATVKFAEDAAMRAGAEYAAFRERMIQSIAAARNSRAVHYSDISQFGREGALREAVEATRASVLRAEKMLEQALVRQQFFVDNISHGVPPAVGAAPLGS